MQNQKHMVCWLLTIGVIAFTSCSSSPDEQATMAAVARTTTATITSSPMLLPTETEVPIPEESPTPDPSPTPEGLVFRDDFSGELAQGWIWGNENPEKWSLTEDRGLEIIGEDAFDLSGDFPQNNVLLRELPQGEIAVTVHLEADPDTDFQQAALWLWESGETYVRINRGYCSHCGGSGFFFDYVIPGLPNGSYELPGFDQTDVYLRIEITSDMISLYYGLEPGQWQRLGRFGNAFQFDQVGIGVTNLDPFGADDDLVARFDWFEITELP